MFLHNEKKIGLGNKLHTHNIVFYFVNRHFQATDNKKFVDVWKMNEEQVKELVTDLLSVDRIIFEQQLGMQWQTPQL